MTWCPHRFIPVLVACSVLAAFAALPPRSPEDLKGNATLIVSGTATDSTQSVEGRPFHKDDVFLLKVKVDQVDKGQGVSPGDTIEIRCWQVNSRPSGWTGPGGHGKIPKKVERSKFFLVKRDDGKWEPLEPNGIEPLPKAP
jgi:hypothetical protein